jgi:signal transduction histidine kinase
VDGAGVLRDVVASQRERAAERGVALDGELAACTLHTDRELLATALRNVVSNAVDFTPRGGRVRCRLSHAHGRIEIDVANPAPGLVDEDLARLAEPFWQKDAARTAAGHAGLGLTLVASISDALGGHLRFSLGDGELHVQLTLEPAHASHS